MLAAYRRGRFDAILTTIMYVLLAFPALIATIAVLSFWTPRSLLKIIVVIGIASIPLVYRVIRTATLSVATKDYVVAAKVQGATDRRILMKELLPNIAPSPSRSSSLAWPRSSSSKERWPSSGSR